MGACSLIGIGTVAVMDAIAVTSEGQGPTILLVHGGASASTTWSGLEELAGRWTLRFVHRRGYVPSPSPPDGRQDFDTDATDLAPLLAGRPHLVAHSYGALGALVAAARAPELVRSLTVIEPPLYYLCPGDPEVAELERMGNAVLGDGLDADPVTLRKFLRLAGSPAIEDGPLPKKVADAVRRARGGRLPGEARVPLEVLRERVPALIASGDHTIALERICDALAHELRAERVIAPGAGHFVPAAPGFADKLESFLLSIT
jgi:pimeloyl-ACP methyl ester carboxylesterase